MVNKKNGIYYTPKILAEYLAAPLVTGNNQTILDPSYGEGSLLLAAERICKQNNSAFNLQLFGCDTKPVNGLLKHLPKANLKEIDFFDYHFKNQFDTILMNPPYVRKHIQDLKKIEKYRADFPELNILNHSADLWAYFLIKAVAHLQKDGNIGAILPWAFLQADYAKPLRKWLTEIFQEINVTTLSDKYFEKTDERIVLVWLYKYGHKNNSIKITSSKSIELSPAFKELPIHSWLADRVMLPGTNDIQQILIRYESEFGFTKFENHATVKIGVVTGAVEYFIVPKETAKKIGFKKSRLIPILRTCDEFPDYIINGKKNLTLLVALKKKDHLKYRSFIRRGIENEYHFRAHSQERTPWYSVKIGKVPDAFFHYRVTKVPYLLLNTDKVQSTNSIHRIYFKDLSDIEKKWIVVSLLSKPSQLSIETNAKTYGRGVLKIEPKSLKQTLVLKKNDKKIDSTYEQIINLLSTNNKEKAVELASEFINNELGIPPDLRLLTEQALGDFQNLRLPDKKS